MIKKIDKIGVHSEYFRPQNLWTHTVWAQLYSGERFLLARTFLTSKIAQSHAECYLHSTMIPEDWHKISD